MKILVIGNGFDLAHGLPTSTEDFLDEVLGDLQEDKYSESVEELKDLWLGPNDNGWAKIIADRQDDASWEGFESEIARVVHLWDLARKQTRDNQLQLRGVLNKIPAFGSQGSYFEAHDIVYRYQNEDALVMVRENMYKSLQRLTRLLELYLCNIVNRIPAKEIDTITKLKPDKIISFNYTDTVERVYGDKWNNPEVCYIHGKAGDGHSINDMNLIFGIDEYLDENSSQLDNYYIRFKKFYQRIVRRPSIEYKRWIEPWTSNHPNADVDQLYLDIWGHSLSVADQDTIRELILTHNSVTTIHYYDRNALDSIVENLVAVIGKEELIERTCCHPAKLLFIEG